MTKQAKLAAKHEKKLKVLTAGYQSRNNNLTKDLEEIGKSLLDTYRDCETFSRMSKTEKINGEVRVTKAKMLYDKQMSRHQQLQGEFDTLSHDIKKMMSLMQRQQNEMAEYAKMEEIRIQADKAKEQLDADSGEEQEAVEIEQEIIEEEEDNEVDNANDELEDVENENSDENE